MAPLRRSVTVLGLLGTGMLASIGTLTDSGSTIILGLAVVAAAVYAGHRAARELDGPDPGDEVPFRREVTELAPL